MSDRPAKFIALAKENKRMDAANALERSRQWPETEEKRKQREALDRRVRARERIERLKRHLAEHPELKAACYLISMGVALLVIQFFLENGESFG